MELTISGVTYDIAPTATLLNVVDAEVTSATIAGVPQVPTITAPAGSRQIRDAYCTTLLHSFATPCILNVEVGTLNNTSLSGCAVPAYTAYPASGSSTTTLYKGMTYSFSAMTDGGAATVSLWIDFDGNGVLDPAEWFDVTRSTVANTPDVISIFIPATAATGLTRMRIRTRASTINTDIDACTSFWFW
jgi:hypothetical protein